MIENQGASKRIGLWLTLAVISLSVCSACGDDAIWEVDGGYTTGSADANVGTPVVTDGAADGPRDSAVDASQRDAQPPDAKATMGDAGTPDAPTQNQIASVCADVARAQCDKFAACSPRLFAQKYASALLCQAAVAWECQNNLRFGGINWTFDQAVVCAAKTAGMICAAWLSDGLDPSCRLGPGLLPDGARCRVRVTSQCGPQSDCMQADASGCGTCRPRTPLFAVCTSKDSCVQEGRCVFDVSGQGRCEPYVALGQSCDARNRCADSLSCAAGRASCVTSVGCKGTCQLTLAGEGESCLERPCDKRRSLSCSQTTFKCELDEACSGSGQMIGCPGPVAIGKPCSLGTPCAAPATCTQGVCAFPDVDAQCTP